MLEGTVFAIGSRLKMPPPLLFTTITVIGGCPDLKAKVTSEFVLFKIVAGRRGRTRIWSGAIGHTYLGLQLMTYLDLRNDKPFVSCKKDTSPRSNVT